MSITVENIFAEVPESSGQEQFLALFGNESVKIQRIVSKGHSSTPGFWYDQGEEEWVIVLRGKATLEFEGGDLVSMKEGDYLTIPRRVRHRVQQTDAETIWIAVHIR